MRFRNGAPWLVSWRQALRIPLHASPAWLARHAAPPQGQTLLSGWHLDKSCQRTNELCTRLRNYLPIPNTGRDADASVAGAGEEDSCRKCGLNAVDPTSVVGPVLSKGAGPAGNPDLAWGEPHAEMQLEVVEDSGDDVFIAQMQHWLAVAAERYSQDLATRGWGPVSPFLGTERDGGD